MVDLKLKIDPSFFEEEVRCGYTVSKEMKEVWAVELDLLNELLRVCKKYDIPITASGGTTLGLIRHKGFIPWDDDIDMFLLRKDYDRLCEVAKEEFKEPYFFQTEYTDPGSFRRHAQLRNSLTTAIRKDEKNEGDFNQGIFIDIFPEDVVIDDEKLFNEQKERAHKLINKAKYYYKFSDAYKYRSKSFGNTLRHIRALIHNKIKPYNEIYREFEEECAKYNDKKTEYVSALSFFFERPDFYTPYDYFDDIIWLPFEMIEMPVGRDYLKVLEIQYGNWQTPLQVGSNHGGIIFDTDKSYKEYLKEK